MKLRVLHYALVRAASRTDSKLTVCALHVRPQLLFLLAVSKSARRVGAFLFFQNVVTYLPREEPTWLTICHLLQKCEVKQSGGDETYIVIQREVLGMWYRSHRNPSALLR